MTKNLFGLNVLTIFAGAGILLVSACAQQNVITHVNQRPIFHPSLISYAARDGAVPLEIHGAPPTGMTAAELAKAVHLPGRAEGVRLITAPGSDRAASASHNTAAAILDDRFKTMLGSEGRDFRIVLVSYPHFQTLPEQACREASEIPSEAGGDVRFMAVFCIGRHEAASGQVRIPAPHTSSKGITDAINLLLIDMSHPQPDGGMESGSRRH
ncbi:MAG: hypothetical protein Q7N95_12235 [Alphaproteobacteria bacterium]|nr:hypothetical protein [Alphaproteobacteria bacterium]